MKNLRIAFFALTGLEPKIWFLFYWSFKISLKQTDFKNKRD